MTLPQTPITPEQVEQASNLFRGLQGYCLVRHGRKFIWLALVRFKAKTAEDQAALRSRIAEIGAQAATAYDLYRSYADYQNARSKGEVAKASELKSGPVLALGLSSTAYSLLPTNSKPLSDSFEKGFSGKYPNFFGGVPSRIDAIVVVADNDLKSLACRAAEIDKSFGCLVEITWEKGFIKTVDGQVRDHFGFPEGISQPVFFDNEPGRTGAWTSSWDPLATLEYVFFPQPGAPPGEYGSLMAFVKIRTDPKAFEAVITATHEGCGGSTDEVKAKILGRKLSGEPLAATGADRNDFDFTADPGFARCPGSAHIRKMNPRMQFLRSNRILRRGALYEENGDKGVLFQCFQSRLETGFETLFEEWGNFRHIPETAGGVDSVLGVLPGSPAGGDHPFTKVLSGEYFFFPSIPFFRRLS